MTLGSWLPGAIDPATGSSSYIAYVVTVSSNATPNISGFKLEKRYSEFYNLYSDLYARIRDVFPLGTAAPFPNDRFFSWMMGVSEDRINKRRQQLDSWLREILGSPEIMTDINCFDKITEFLGLKL